MLKKSPQDIANLKTGLSLQRSIPAWMPNLILLAAAPLAFPSHFQLSKTLLQEAGAIFFRALSFTPDTDQPFLFSFQAF
ncbi:MAG: hypothetical protein JNN28_07570 [Saprospiraceae bacterium]|nr:hypothetical protein [Saprospiraceae bacterium]